MYGGAMEMESIKQQLHDLFGFLPYDYQVRVAQAMLEGKNVILRAPTGSGKTEAALAPFLLARETQHPTFPLKMMIASPMKTLVKSTHARALKFAEKLDLLGLDVRLHTGEDQGAPLLEGDVVVTTIDQLISNYAHIPLSMSNGRSNIGAAAVISSYVVFDEFHLFDPKRAFQTALLMIEQLRGITPFLLMTATLSSEMVARLEQTCNAVVIEPTETELKAMLSQQKTRYITRAKGQLTATVVKNLHQRRSLVILNTVARAQAMAADLTALKLPNTRIEVIHSQFLPSDRAAKEAQLEDWMGEDSTENIILVATQAIEVGINISSEHLHTELCPANSLLQRAGRCARFKGEVGTVHVYDLPLDDSGKKRIMPYKELQEELEATWEALKTLKDPVGFTEEAALINAVHTARDLGYLKDAIDSKVNHKEKLFKAQNNGERVMASSLIREIINQSVILHEDPHKMTSWRDVSSCEMVSLFPGKLNGLLTEQTDSWGETDGWVIMIPSETLTEYGTLLTWKICNDPRVLQLSPLVALNPKRVFYSPEFGLRPDILEPSLGNFPRLKKVVDSGERQDWWYTFETYREHIENVMNSLNTQAQDILRACPKVDTRFKLPLGTLEQAIRIAIAAHDIGKLSTGWQNWTRNWQRQQLEVYPNLLWNGHEGSREVVPQPKGVYCAHTDYHPEIDKTRSKAQPKRPGHAGESAHMLEQTFFDHYLKQIGDDELGAQVFCGIYGAIARHHGAYNSGKTEKWKMDAGSSQEIKDVFSDLTQDVLDINELLRLEREGVPAAQPLDFMPQPTELLAWIAYTLISRALRQSDNHSFIRHKAHQEPSKEDNEN
jgi:CRISPR-associated endonuclease/helicase Cas3